MKPTIALFIADPKCSVQSGNGIMKALGEHYNFKIFSKNELEYNFFDGVDMIAVPGGFGDSDSYDNLLKHNADRVREFVAQGGRYLGICMGAYWAGKHYFNILNNIDAYQYIKRPNTDTRRPLAKSIAISWQGHADHEAERGLNEIVQRAAAPRDMRRVKADGAPHRTVGEMCGHHVEVQQLHSHQKHHHPAIRIQ